MVDTLSAGGEPTEGQWASLLSTPGYRLATRFVATARSDMEIAFAPGKRADYDSLVAQGGDRASRLRHLRRAATLRDALITLADSLERTPPIDDAIRNAERYLPPGITGGQAPPLVGIAIFRYDGYAAPAGTVVDLLYVYDNGLVSLLSHEFHHVYAGQLNEASFPPADSPDAPLVRVLLALRNEGTADLVDKPHPLVPRSSGMQRYATRYNAEYARTLEVVQRFDSLLTAVNADPGQIGAAGRLARSLFWSNGHAHGAYMARTIDEVLGRESVFESLRSPFTFLANFAEAVRLRGGGSVFSAAALAVLDELDQRYGLR